MVGTERVFGKGAKILMAMEEGLVIKSTGSWYEVLKINKEIIQCRIKGNIRLNGIKNTNPVTVGDSVDIEQSLNGEWMIADIHPRKNYIIRKSINLSKKNQIIASNIDFAFLIVTLKNPRTSFGFIDRFLVTAEAYSIKPILVLNKMDLYGKNEEMLLEEFEYIYSQIGYKILKTSIVSGQGIQELKELVSSGTSMFSGHSGVGKSSLLNCIEKDLDLRTGKISDVHSKGKHTTTFAEMILLKSGGKVIDTPGIKELGIVDLEKHEIRDFFPEMQQISHLCKFNNCLHINEPGCKILSALEDETISGSRYMSYLSIFQNELTEEKDYTS